SSPVTFFNSSCCLAHPFLNGPTNWISSISCFYAVSDESLRPRKDLLRANKMQIVDENRRYHSLILSDHLVPKQPPKCYLIDSLSSALRPRPSFTRSSGVR